LLFGLLGVERKKLPEKEQFTFSEWIAIIEVYSKDGIERGELVVLLGRDYGVCPLVVLASISRLIARGCLKKEEENGDNPTRTTVCRYHLTPQVAIYFSRPNQIFL
jgi:hypothetical protein